ncbi:hypothetical protein [Streptomyces sp. NPDC046759]|uniref:hypothetical protein n=1 Tax=Streptomyces sp. NPDC046759 TaxID=3155019 RepID=UPI00340562AE
MRPIPARLGTAGTTWARLGACVLLAVTGLTGTAAGSAVAASGSAVAAAPAGARVTLTSPTTQQAYPYDAPGGPMYVRVTNTGTTTIDSYTFTLDGTSLQRVADVTKPCPQKADHVLVCKGEGPLVPRGDEFFPVPLTRAKGALVGASGELRITVESHGVQLASRTVKVTVPDEGLVPDRLDRTPDVRKVKPGTSMKVTGGFTNYGAKPLNSTLVVMSYEGLRPDQEFSNCEYNAYGDTTQGGGLARCEVKGPIDVNGSYDLDLGSLTADTAVIKGQFRVGYGGDYQWGSDRPHHRGTGGELKLTPRPASAPPARPQPTEATFRFDVDNTADIQAVGTTVRQKGTGALVKATVGVRNKGPAGMAAWTGSDPGEDPPYEIHVSLPAGTEAVATPEHCHKFTDRKGTLVDYQCWQDVQDLWIEPGQYTTWSFVLRVIDPKALKPGRIKVDSLSTDPVTSNNSAAIVVKAPGQGSGGNGGTGDGGTTGSQGSVSGGGPGSDGGSGTATAAGGSTHGGMADTGTSPLVQLAAGAAGVAVLLGGGLFLGFRRSRRG